MSEEHEVNYNLNVNATLTYGEIRKVEMSVLRILSYIKRFSGNEEIDKMVTKIEEVIRMARLVQVAIRALQMAEMEGGPILWLYAGITTVSAVVTGMTTVQQLGS